MLMGVVAAAVVAHDDDDEDRRRSSCCRGTDEVWRYVVVDWRGFASIVVASQIGCRYLSFVLGFPRCRLRE